MSTGQQFPSEWRSHSDPISAVTVEQLTNHKGHSHHLYFTNPGWYVNDSRLLLSSERHNATNFYSLELATGTITQLTDLGLYKNSCHQPPQADFPKQDSPVLSGSSNLGGESSQRSSFTRVLES